jgi:hypothetical protein
MPPVNRPLRPLPRRQIGRTEAPANKNGGAFLPRRLRVGLYQKF